MSICKAFQAAALAATLLVGLCSSSSAQEQRVAIQDATGFLLPDATVTYTDIDGTLVKAAHFGDGTVSLSNIGAHTELFVEHPFFGRQRVEVAVPSSPRGVVLLRLDGQGAEVKFLPSISFNTRTGAAGGGAPVPVSCTTGVGCQLPDQMGHGGSGTLAATSDNNPGAGFQVADNISPTASGSISSLCWWGLYLDFTLFADCGPGTGDAFTVIYYNDDAGGTIPGSVRAGPFALSLSAKFATGNVVCAGTLCIAEYQFEASHAPVAVSAGECLWVEIANSTTGNCFWLWNTAPPGDGRSAQAVGGSYAPTDYDLAMCVDIATTTNGCGAPPPPSGDECTTAVAISGTGLFPFDNTNATNSGPDHAACLEFGSDEVQKDVWFAWTAPATSQFSVETCSLTTVDTKIAAYDGCTCPVTDGRLLDCNDDDCGFQSRVFFNAVSGQCYLIRIGTFPGATGGTGNFLISQLSGPPANDFCANAIAVAVPSITSGTTAQATVDTDVPNCVQSNNSPGVWYSVQGTGTTMTASVCTGTLFDSKISVYCGTCAAPTCIDGNDDFCGLQSSVSWCSQNGATYLILVHGFGGDSGPFELTVGANGVSCTATVQCLPTGACCSPTGCTVTDSGTCTSMGGAYMGDNTSCGGFDYFPFSCTYGFEDIRNVGTAVTLSDDSGVVVPIPFSFNFYGVDKNSVAICSNGYLTFGTDFTDFINVPIPDPADPDDMIAPLWDDLNPGAGGQVQYFSSGFAPNRAFIVQWTDVPQFGNTDQNTFQAILFENNNRVSLRYLQVTPEAFAGDYTIGIENADGSDAESFPGTAATAGGCLQIVPEPVPSSCPDAIASIDMVPQVCPNPLNTQSRGAVWVSILGRPDFDVNKVDVHTVYLSRIDGQGTAVSPFEGPPGPFSRYEDAGAPWLGPPSQCHEVGPDGTQDLSMRFHNLEMAENLELGALAYGTQVEIRVSGYTLDGTWFEGADTMTLQAPPPRVNLDVRSNIVDTWIEVTPADVVEDDHGWSSFSRLYPLGTSVTLTAPASQPLGTFKGWKINGQFVSLGNPVLQIPLTQDVAVYAIYERTRTLGGFGAR